MKNFSNSVLLPENLPEIETATFNPLDKKYLTIQLARIILVFFLLAAGFTIFLIISEGKPPLFITIPIAAAILLISGGLATVAILGFPKKGYLVRENDVSYQSGLITHRVTSVPLNRIQHVEVNQGVLAKLLNLSAVKIYTAGGTSSDLSVPGLPVDEARKLKAFLSGKISEHE